MCRGAAGKAAGVITFGLVLWKGAAARLRCETVFGFADPEGSDTQVFTTNFGGTIWANTFDWTRGLPEKSIGGSQRRRCCDPWAHFSGLAAVSWRLKG